MYRASIESGYSIILSGEKKYKERMISNKTFRRDETNSCHGVWTCTPSKASEMLIAVFEASSIIPSATLCITELAN